MRDHVQGWKRGCLPQVSPELGNQYADVIAAGDVALYGGLTALASFDRAELKRSIVENTTFRELLELNPDVCTHATSSWVQAVCMQQCRLKALPC